MLSLKTQGPNHTMALEITGFAKFPQVVCQTQWWIFTRPRHFSVVLGVANWSIFKQWSLMDICRSPTQFVWYLLVTCTQWSYMCSMFCNQSCWYYWLGPRAWPITHLASLCFCRPEVMIPSRWVSRGGRDRGSAPHFWQKITIDFIVPKAVHSKQGARMARNSFA